MDSIIIIAILVIIAPIIVSIVAFSKIRKLQIQMEQLKSSVALLKRQVVHGNQVSSSTLSGTKQSESDFTDDVNCSFNVAPQSVDFDEHGNIAPSKNTLSERKVPVVKNESSPKQTLTNHHISGTLPEPNSLLQNVWLKKCITHFKQHWLVWVGGITLMIGIAYLVEVMSQYIDFTPVMRILAAFIGSCFILLIAERFHRKEQNYTHIGFAYVPAVISSAGCMGLYSTVIFSYTLYDFLPPVMSLLTMGGISILTLSLYLRFGPLMAVLGLIGGFTAPFWFADQSSDGFGLAGYISFITVAGLLLAGHVKRSWIYPIVLVPYYLWMLAIIQNVPSESLVPWGLIFLTFSIYMILGVPILGWRLSPSFRRSIDYKTYNIVIASAAIGVLVLAVLFSQSVSTYQMYSHFYFLLLIAWLPLIKQYRTHSRFLSYSIVAILLLVAYLLVYSSTSESLPHLILLVSSMVVITLLLLRTFIQHMCRPKDLFTKYLLLSAPVMLMGVGWWRFGSGEYLWLWSLYTLAIVSVYCRLSPLLKSIQRDIYACMHLVLAISLLFIFSGTELTLMLALQVLVISWQISKTSHQPANWVLKVALMVAIARATLMSFIPSWQVGMISVYGMLLLLAALFAMFVYSYRLLREQHANLANWLEGAMAQLVVVIVFSQSHYWLVTSFSEFQDMSLWGEYGFRLSILYAVETLLISAAYQYRVRNCEHQFMKKLYINYANLLFGASLVLMLLYNTILSPLFLSNVSVGATPIINWLSIGWFIPGILILSLNHLSLSSSYMPYKACIAIGGSILAIWLGMSIRQFWQQENITVYQMTSMAEQISYSFAGIVVGIAFALFGVFRIHNQLKLFGFAILVVVIAKVVLIDTSELQGIHRAVSYLVLGGALVGLGWVFQRLNATRSTN